MVPSHRLRLMLVAFPAVPGALERYFRAIRAQAAHPCIAPHRARPWGPSHVKPEQPRSDQTSPKGWLFVGADSSATPISPLLQVEGAGRSVAWR
jgi:hypothetical protein